MPKQEAIIEIIVPDFKIEKKVSIYFPDTMKIEGTVNKKENGHWDDSCPIVSDGSLWKSWVCSKCDNRVMVKTPYCCNCGSKMDGE